MAKKATQKKTAKKATAKKSPAKAAAGSSKKVTFKLLAPDAKEVLLVACFTKWEDKAKKMKKLKNGTWNVRAELKVGETYRYRFIVDGKWVNDPEAEAMETTPYGSENCLITVA